jgi:hypothetical protein
MENLILKNSMTSSQELKASWSPKRRVDRSLQISMDPVTDTFPLRNSPVLFIRWSWLTWMNTVKTSMELRSLLVRIELNL